MYKMFCFIYILIYQLNKVWKDKPVKEFTQRAWWYH